MSPVVDLRVRFDVDDAELTELHRQAFGGSAIEPQPWATRLERHGLTWVGAFDEDVLVGFVQVCWDGGSHAFLLDTAVRPTHQRRGIGRDLVLAATAEAARAGCQWLHVDYEPHLQAFYRDACGFSPTDAGLVRLDPPERVPVPMAVLHTRPMTEAEFDVYRERVAQRYADEHVRAGNWSQDEALTRAARELDRLLPLGRGTADMLLVVAEAPAGEQVGTLWISLRRPTDVADTGWIYDIEVAPEYRGLGWGRSLLQAAEDEARSHGLTGLGLNVFGSNEVACRLYVSAGYDIASQQMRKLF